MKSPAVPPVNVWFLAGAGGKIIGRGRGLPPGEVPNFGRGREGPGVVILAGGRGRGPGRPTALSQEWISSKFKGLNSRHVNLHEYSTLVLLIEISWLGVS